MTAKQIRVMVLNDMEKLGRTLFRLEQGKFQLTCTVLHRPEMRMFCGLIMTSSLCYVWNVCGYL